MSESPQAAIRRYLDEQGGRVDAFVGQLMQTWSLETWTEADRAHVGEALASVDVYSDPPLASTDATGDALILFVAERAPRTVQGDPAEVALHTVEQNGGTYRTDVSDLLGLFGRQQLTAKARSELGQRLAGVGIGVRPDLSLVERNDPVELYILEPATAATAAAPPQAARSPAAWDKLRPRTWKGWMAYGLVGLVLFSAVTGDDPTENGGSGADPTFQEVVPSDDNGAERRLERERERVEQERAELRRERARARRAEAAAARRRRAREAQAAEERRREQEALAAAPPPPEPVPAESCHPSYDPCLDPNSSDYDCEGGSGDGPDYTGQVTVTGSDDYDLDADGDGIACDS